MVANTVNETTSEASEDLIDLRSLGLIAQRRFKPFLIVAGAVFLLGMIVTMLLPDKYSSTANVLIDRRTVAVADVQSVLSGLPADSASVDTEVQVLRSPALIRQVVTRLKLDQNPEFNSALQPPGLLDTVRSAVRGLFASSEDEPKSQIDRVTAAVNKNLGVSRQGLTYVIGVTFESNDPQTSAKVANAVVAQYLSNQEEEKRNAARQARAYLDARLSGLRSDVQSKEGAAETIRAKAGLPSRENASSYDEQAIFDLSRQSITLESELAEKRARLAAAQRAGGEPAALPDVIESNVIRDLKSQRSAALARNADISNRYGPLHPETEKARRELAQIDAEIGAEMGRITASLRNEVSVAEGRLGVIRGALGSQRGAAVANSRNEVAINQFEREAAAARAIYEDFLRRTKETAASEDLAKPDGAVISVARVPNKPSGPNRPLLAALSLLVAAVLGAFAIIIAEILDVKISSGADIRRHLGLSRIASVPGVTGQAADDRLAAMIETKPLSSYAEAFRSLASQLNGTEVDAAKVVMVTSSLPHEGKTSIAASLASSIAKAGDRILLVETDIRRPNLANSLGLRRPEIGIGEVLAGSATAGEAIVRDADRNIDLLLVGTGPQDVEMFRGERFGQFIAHVRPQYRYIVIDTPPVLAISDPRHIARLADSVLFVTRWRRTSRFAARAAVEALREAGAPLLGVVLNGVDLKAQSLYSRDDSLAFYGAYRQYYTE